MNNRVDKPQKIDSLPLENQVSIRNYEININACSDSDVIYLQNELIALTEQKYIKMAMANSYLKGDFDSLINGGNDSNKINTPQIKIPSVSELPLQEQLSIQVLVNAIRKCSDTQILKEYCLYQNRDLHIRSVLIKNLFKSEDFSFTNKQNIQLDTDNSDD